jgi:hypothetical protein
MSDSFAAALPPPPPPAPAPAGLDATRSRATVVGQSALGMVGLGGALLALRAVDIHAPACPFRTITGIACPGCGMTRLAAAMPGGDLATAVAHDPAGALFLVVLATVGLVHLIRVVLRGGGPPAWLGHRAVPYVLGTLLVAHWATTLVWGGMLST